MDHSELIKITFKNKIIAFKMSLFDTDVDVEDVLKIDSFNILGEILTFPVIMNRLGNLVAEMDELLAEAKLELEIKAAELGEFYRKKLVKKTTDSAGKEKITLPTIAEIDNAILLDVFYQNARKKSIRLQKEKQNIDSFYWAALDKSKKLDVLSSKLKPEEFEKEIIEDTINGILIKSFNNKH